MKTPTIPLLFLTACCFVSVHADVVTLGADKDTTIFQNQVNNSLGGGPGVFVGTANSISPSPRRALMSFDLSGIPAGSTITDVQLTLTLGMASGLSPGTATIGLFELTQNWGEGTAGSTATGIGGTGNGFPASAGDATWNAASFPGTLWTTVGGDHASTASASLALTGTTPGTAYTWLSTPQLVADAQGWLDTPASNFGWELINANETSLNTFYAFYSSEWTGSSQRPALQVTYTVPEPAPGSLAAIAALLLLSIRPMRRRGSAEPARWRCARTWKK